MKKPTIRWTLFILYCLFIIWFTVLKREPSDKREVELSLFWTYRLLFSGAPNGKQVVTQSLQNILFFIPFGFLLAFNKWWKAFIAGAVFSIVIEAVQYFGGYGLAEIDDVICNTLGALIGFWMWIGITVVLKRLCRLEENDES